MLSSIIVEYTKGNRVISHKYLVHGTTIEIIWTIAPAVILVFIAFPSFKLIYLMDEVVDPAITLKVIGHQWYWSYEYSDYADQEGTTINFDSYMIPTNDLTKGQFRLLEVDEKVVVPANTHVRVIITSADVIHSWAVPSLGVKLDAVPGRLNQLGFLANREGIFHGQCSEICGANHAFMPIVVEAVNLETYCEYINSRLAEAK
jgi:cytochrome c oxidase subunit 2